MEDWDKYCSISKNARAILNSLEPSHFQPTEPEIQPKKDWNEVICENLIKYADELELAESESIKFHQILERLNLGKEGIVISSKKINEKCSKLLKEREKLVMLNSAIQSKYFYYVHYENLEGQVICLCRDPTSLKKKFLEVSAQIEDAIVFFSDNPNYRESDYYKHAYENLSDMIKSALSSALTEQLQQFYSQYENYFKIMPGSEDISKIFHHMHLAHNIYSESYYLSNSIISSYFKIRNKQIKQITNETLQQIKQESTILKQSQASLELLNRFWRKENKLFTYYFSEVFSQDPLKTYFLVYTDPVYELIRENLIQEIDIEALCQASALLQECSKQSQIFVFSKLYEDVQERIIYSATLYINQNITPAASEDTIHSCVYKTIKLLKILHLKVSNEIFDSLAGESFSVCISALNGSAPQDDFIETHNFLIRNLLHLRKEIEDLGVSFKGYHYKQLDFTDTRRLFWKLVMGEVSLQKQGLLAELVSAGVPKFSEKDPKDIESEFASVCQSYILKTFHEIANPILVLILKSKEMEIPYEQVAKVLMESSNRISNTFKRFCNSLIEILDESNYQQMTNSVSSQILKAFHQLVSYMEQHYPNMPLPSITDIESLLKINEVS
jgi:Sec34-like family